VQTVEPIEMPFGKWTQVGPRKHVLDGVHIGATWQIRLNRPCTATMRPFVKLLWPLVILSVNVAGANVTQCCWSVTATSGELLNNKSGG